ncbi:stage II sporulation protein M [Ornithinibacillus halotolerans]|uniref:Stage II sporulation protein M n=1 Tax=Ornithinibacillus halotolerans TaxID=1274357 RepID=A0A916RLI7_9BACI|nr:stage II sporulation protein M [Ornithinibacillus halotolerans]GGA60768.1 stage II sporulation protein M [Ornithinibacillus halotolerans]
MNRRSDLLDHFRTYATIYVFMIILFLTGIIFGAIIVNSMHFVQKQDLFFYLEQFFGTLSAENPIASSEILKDSIFYHIRYLLLLFVLGLSVIGLPIVWILIFLKGLVVGFSVGFIVNQLGMNGFLLATLSIAPQNIIVIPIYIIAGSLSMIFSISLLNKLFTRKVSLSRPVLAPFVRYITAFAVLVVISFIPAIIEAYISNEAMVSYIKSLYPKN